MEQLPRRGMRAGLGMGQRVRDGHEHSRRRTVAETSAMNRPAPVVEREKVVVVSAGQGAGLVEGIQLESGNSRERLGEQRTLDFPDHMKLPVQRGQGRAELIAKHQVLRPATEQPRLEMQRRKHRSIDLTPGGSSIPVTFSPSPPSYCGSATMLEPLEIESGGIIRR